VEGLEKPSVTPNLTNDDLGIQYAPSFLAQQRGSLLL
jgi:hypothetical protein